jgi:hypothetical protein
VSNIDKYDQRGYGAGVLFNDRAPDGSVPRLPLEPAHAVEQMLRRAFRVGPADATDADADTWSAAPRPVSDFWTERSPRARRLRIRVSRSIRSRLGGNRGRQVGAIVLVIGLAAAWLATSRVGGVSHSVRRGSVGPSVVSRPLATPAPRPSSALVALVPQGARCTDDHESAAEVRCSIAGVEVSYRSLPSSSLRAAYLAALVPGLRGGSMALAAGSGPPKCALGSEDERSWSRPSAPRRAVGRYACRVEQGRAVMWWTVDDRGLLAHATASAGDLASLFAWWESHSER